MVRPTDHVELAGDQAGLLLANIFGDAVWQMSLGERAAVEGVLARQKPTLAIEIGTAEGACLQRIAAHSREVHSFDLVAPSLPPPANVTLHTGDSHQLLPEFLDQVAQAGRNVDFVMVDGDHSPEGVRQDLEDLLDSPALARSVILIHDTANERVRAGVEAVRYAAWPKVAFVELDWIGGRLFAEADLRGELWYGLGMVLLDSTRQAYLHGIAHERRYEPAGPLLLKLRELIVSREQAPAGISADSLEAVLRTRVANLAGELAAARLGEARQVAELLDLRRRTEDAERRLARAEGTLSDVMGSASWKLTEPLRMAKARAGRRQG